MTFRLHIRPYDAKPINSYKGAAITNRPLLFSYEIAVRQPADGSARYFSSFVSGCGLKSFRPAVAATGTEKAIPWLSLSSPAEL